MFVSIGSYDQFEFQAVQFTFSARGLFEMPDIFLLRICEMMGPDSADKKAVRLLLKASRPSFVSRPCSFM